MNLAHPKRLNTLSLGGEAASGRTTHPQLGTRYRLPGTMRVFIALDIEDAIRDRISRFMDGVREFAPDARWVRPESLHVTLKFIGEKSAEAVEQIKEALAAVKGQAVEMGFRGHGFFPTAKSARGFWVGIESGPALASLANAVDDVTAGFGFPKVERAFDAQLTLARCVRCSGSHRSPHVGGSTRN